LTFWPSTVRHPHHIVRDLHNPRRFRNDVDEEKDYFATCSERLYPNLPSPPLPHTAPLANHTGTFHNAGYGDFKIVLDCGNSETVGTSLSNAGQLCQLQVKKPRGGPANIPLVVNLEHKSGDYWLGWAVVFDAGMPEACLEAQFRVDTSGAVNQFAIEAGLDDVTPLIWFERIET
jgi:hypothetical protein